MEWEPHINMIYPKISRSIKIIVRLRQFCLTETILVVYNSRTLPFLQYCCIIWVSTSSIHIPPLLGPQIRAIQMIIKFLLCAHSYPLFKTLHILDIFKIYKHQLSCFVFLHTAKLQPITLSFRFHFYLWFSQVLNQAKEQPSHLFSQNNLPLSA